MKKYLFVFIFMFLSLLLVTSINYYNNPNILNKVDTLYELYNNKIWIKERCIEVLSEEKYDPENFPSWCDDNVWCYSIVYDFNKNLSYTDDHDPNNYCQWLEEAFDYLLQK